MAGEYLSGDQVARYGRFAGEPSVQELESFFRGMTWLNVVSDRVMGLGGIVMPGTLRDSLGILDAVFNLDTP